MCAKWAFCVDWTDLVDKMPPTKKGAQSSTAPGLVQQTIRQLNKDRSVSPQKRRRQSGENTNPLEEVKALIEAQMEEFAKLREEFQDLANSLKAEVSSLTTRVKDLEEHVNNKDNEMEEMEVRLKRSEDAVRALQVQLEENEVVSRLPTLIFSGPAVEKSAPLRPGVPTQPARAVGGGAEAAPAAPPEADADLGGSAPVSGAEAASGVGSGVPGTGEQGRLQQPENFAEAAAAPSQDNNQRTSTAAAPPPARRPEDVEATLIELLNSAFPGLGLQRSDIDRVHRTGRRIWCRFVKSGAGSMRDRLYQGRLSLKGRVGNELYISECLTKSRQEIFSRLLALKRQGKIYTVFTRYGSVYVKEQRYSNKIRIDDMNALINLNTTSA